MQQVAFFYPFATAKISKILDERAISVLYLIDNEFTKLRMRPAHAHKELL